MKFKMLNNHKWKFFIKILALIVVIMPLVVRINSPSVSASLKSRIADNNDANYDELKDKVKHMIYGMSITLERVLTGNQNTIMIGDGGGLATLIELRQVCIGDLETTPGNPTATAYSLAAGATAILKTVAAFIVLIKTLAALIRAVENGREWTEMLMNTFITLAVAGMILINCDQITNTVCKLGLEISSDMASAAITIPTMNDTIDEFIEDFYGEPLDDSAFNNTLSDQLGRMWGISSCNLKMTIPYIISLLLIMVVEWQVVSIFFELAILRIFAPIPIAMVYQDGLHGPGMKYLLNLVATGLRLGACSVIAIIYGSIAIVPAQSIMGLILWFGIQLAVIGAIKKTEKITQLVMGV